MTSPASRRSSSAPLFDEPSSLTSEGSGIYRVVHVSQHGFGPGLASVKNPAGKSVTGTPAQCLRRMRVRLGLTLNRAATDYGVAVRTWSNWEHGYATVPAGALLWLAELIDAGSVG